jgi:hypothetical protein
MALPVEKNRLMLGGALLLTMGVSAWLGLMDQTEEAADVVEIAKPVSAKRDVQPRRAASAVALPVLAEARSGGENGQQGKNKQQAEDAFKSHSWFVPPPPPPRPVQAVAAPPAPPPLPFSYLGNVQDGEHMVVFLAKGQRLYTVRKGEVFDGQYRLEDVGNGRIELVYLPLNAKQNLVLKGAF